MSDLSRGMPKDRKEAALLAADLAEHGVEAVITAIERYKREGHPDMAGWVSRTYAVLCAVDSLFRESEWTS